MSVSEHDRDYFRRIGEIKAECHAKSAAAHAGLPLSQRLEQSWELYLTHREPHRDYLHDDPLPFYERARKLGLYLASEDAASSRSD